MCVLYLVLLILLNFTLINGDIGYLTSHFFDNLKNDPKLVGSELNTETKFFVDKQIENYLSVVRKNREIHRVSRRSLPIDDLDTTISDDYGVFKLKEITPKYKIGTKLVRNIVLFKQSKNEALFASTLESNHMFADADEFKIYRQQADNFIGITSVKVKNATKIAVFPNEKETLIVITENCSNSSKHQMFTIIYNFDNNENLNIIQTLAIDYTSDILIWKQDEEIFLAVSQQQSIENGTVSYETETPIYKWTGSYFDELQKIQTCDNRKMTAFTIGNSHYLVAVNFRNNRRETNVYSEIFKYDLNLEMFVLHQKIATFGAVDAKYFYLKSGKAKENYLVFANYVEEDTENLESNSVVYKYVDDYFLPFQSLALTAPTHFLPVEGPKGEFVLFAVTKFEGLKAFQYNGWRFVEVHLSLDEEIFSKGIISISSLVACDHTFIALANENDLSVSNNVFELNFSYENQLEKFRKDMFQWCTNALKSAKALNMNTKIKRSSLEIFDKETDEIEENDEIKENLKRIQFELDEQMEEFERIKSSLMQNLQSPASFITNNIQAELIIVNTLSTNKLETTKLNDLNADNLVQNKIDLERNFEINGKLQIESVTVQNPTIPDFINGKPAQNLVYKNKVSSLKVLEVFGNAIFENKLEVDGKVNSLVININTTLLNRGEQHILGVMNLENVQADYIDNDDFVNSTTKEIIIRSIDQVYVTNFTYGGLLNGIDLPILDKYALKIFGDQEITADYLFDNLHVHTIKFKGLISDKSVVEEFLSIKDGSYLLQGNTLFANKLYANNSLRIEPKGMFNHLNVYEDSKLLNVLQKNTTERQRMTKMIVVDNLVVLQPIMFRLNFMKLPEFHQLNPVMNIEEEVEIIGDRYITGKIIVEKSLAVQNVESNVEKYSLLHLEKYGLKLTEEVIPSEIEFTQQINVENLITRNINGRDVENFIVTGLNEPVNISGWKIFLNDLTIIGTTNLVNANGINMPTLAETTLRTSGNQLVMGTYIFENIQIENITAPKTFIGTKSWKEVFTTNTDQKILGTTIVTNFKSEQAKISNLTLKGRINNKNFDEIILDTPDINQTFYNFTSKKFSQLTIKNLTVKNGIDMQKLPNALKPEQEYTMSGNVALFDSTIENIYFTDYCNGIHRSKFEKLWYLRDGEEVTEDLHFESITVYGNTEILSEMINNLHVWEIVENTVKIDEDHHFKSVVVTAPAVVSLKNIDLKGNIVGLDLSTVINSDSAETQVFDGKIDFKGNVTVRGELVFENGLNGLNFAKLCQFTELDEWNETVVINGSVLFAKGPVIQYVNDVSLSYLLENIWFKDASTIITGYYNFDQIEFHENIFATFIDGVNLNYLSEHYLSKTKNQTVLANINIEETIFEKGLSAPNAKIAGTINEINLAKFLRTVLLNNVDQVFEEPVYLQNIYIKSITGDFTLNGMNLETDFLRYDKENIVTSKKTFDNVYIETLKINPEILVQNVKLVNLLSKVVMKDGINRIHGRKTFKGSIEFLKGISLNGTLNGFMFNSNEVLLKSIPQNITGKKHFLNNVTFENVHLKGTLNNFNLSEELANQVNTNEGIKFFTPIVFNRTITASNVNIESHYQGKNIKKLLKSLNHFSEFNNYDNNYKHLLQISEQVKESLKDQAFFLSHYDILQTFPESLAVIPLELDTNHRLVTLMTTNESTFADIRYWNESVAKFVSGGQIVNIGMRSNYAAGLSFPDEKFAYFEGTQENDGNTAGLLMGYENETSVKFQQIPTEGCKSISTLVLPKTEEKCIVMVYNAAVHPNIICNFGLQPTIFQTLKSIDPYKVITTELQGIPHIILLHYENEHNEAAVSIWKYFDVTGKFDIIQEIHVVSPNSISTINYKDTNYLAISSGHIPDTLHEEAIEIMKFNRETQQYTDYQTIKLQAPIQVEFTLLPTKELILYVLTDNPAAPLIVYEYSGIAGFEEKIVASALPRVNYLRQFSRGKKHFVTLEREREVLLLEAVFKGERMEE